MAVRSYKSFPLDENFVQHRETLLLLNAMFSKMRTYIFGSGAGNLQRPSFCLKNLKADYILSYIKVRINGRYSCEVINKLVYITHDTT